MGRITASVTISNLTDRDKRVRIDALVDTGASHLILPTKWKDRRGDLEEVRTVELETATQRIETGSVCGPVRLQIEGFKPIFTSASLIVGHGRDTDTTRIRHGPDE